MYCMHCGTKNPDGARFCNNCGKPMNTAPAAPSGSTGGSRSSGNRSSGNRSGGGKGIGNFLKRLVLTIVVSGLAYSLSYACASGSFFKDKPSKKDTDYSASSVQIQAPAAPAVVQTEPAKKSETGYIADLGGSWESVKLKDGNFNLNVSALAFSQKVYNCTSMTVNMDVTMNAGTKCKDWNIWGRSGGSFTKIGKIYLSNGDGYVSQTVTFSSPVSFDAIAITPTVVGGYSWSMGLSITDVYYR